MPKFDTSAASGRESPRARNQSLDALRAVAILLVLGWHMALPDAIHPRAASWLEFLRRPGWVGVDLFFVLSGYLVAGLLFAEHRLNGSVRAGRFLARRSFKIYPAFYLYLWLTFAFGVYETRTPTGHELLMHGLFLQNYAGHSPGVWVHTWSLAVEEHFYLLLVALLAWLGRRRPLTARQAVAWFCAVALTVLAVRTATVLWLLRHTKHFSDVQDWFFQTHLRIDALLFGVLLAYLYHHRPDLWERCATHGTRILVCSLLLLVPAFIFEHDSPFTSSVGLTLYYVAFGGILVFVLTRPGPTSLWASIAAPVGVYSYSIYVWHGAVKHWAAPAVQSVTGMRPGYLASTLLYFGGSLMVGIGMAKLIEFPILRLRDRYVPLPLSTRTHGSPSTSLTLEAGSGDAGYLGSADRAVAANSR